MIMLTWLTVLVGCSGGSPRPADDTADDYETVDTDTQQFEQICDDQVDNDGDGDADCDDDDCADAVNCNLTCIDDDLGTAVGPAVAQGDTTGEPNSVPPTCASAISPKHHFRWTAPADGCYTFDSIGTSFDAVVALYEGCLDMDRPVGEIACDNDSAGSLQATVSVADAVAGQAVIVEMGGATVAGGNYVLNITSFSCP